MHTHKSGTYLFISLLQSVFVKYQNSRRGEEYHHATLALGDFQAGFILQGRWRYENPTTCKKDNLISPFALWDLTVRGLAAVTRMEQKWICKCELLTSGGGFDFAEEKTTTAPNIWRERRLDTMTVGEVTTSACTMESCSVCEWKSPLWLQWVAFHSRAH